jgi:hypothetical protein
MFVRDYIMDGRGFGAFGGLMEQVRFDPGMLRPYIDKNDQLAVTVNTGRWTMEKGERRPIKEHRRVIDLMNRGIGSPAFNTALTANATTLRKEEWIELDRVIQRPARYRLRAWADLAAANSYGGFNGMSKMILEHEAMSDPGEAIVDMDALTPGRNDGPLFQLRGVPLPIIHSDFWFSSRMLAISRNTGSPLDTAMGEAAGRRVAEKVEKMTIGVTTGPTYGGNSTYVGGYDQTSAVYGYTNFPYRLTKTNLTAPTGTNPDATVSDVLAMRDTLFANKFYGPFMLYHSNDWDKHMDNDYARAVVGANSIATSKTLRQRLRDIEGILDVRRLDFLFGAAPVATANQPWGTGPGADVDATLKPTRLVMVQMTPDTAQAVNGMDITTVQWESVGGMRLNFKVMCIQVPRLRTDFYGNVGILDATTS